MGVVELRKGAAKRWLLQGMGEFAGSLDCCVFMSKVGYGDDFGEEGNGVDDAFGMGAWDPDPIALVMVEGWSHIPTIGTVGGPSLAICGFFMNNDTRPWGC